MPIRPSRRNRMVAVVIVAACLAAGVALLLVHVTGGGKADAAAPEAKLRRNLDALVAAGAPARSCWSATGSASVA